MMKPVNIYIPPRDQTGNSENIYQDVAHFALLLSGRKNVICIAS